MADTIFMQSAGQYVRYFPSTGTFSGTLPTGPWDQLTLGGTNAYSQMAGVGNFVLAKGNTAVWQWNSSTGLFDINLGGNLVDYFCGSMESPTGWSNDVIVAMENSYNGSAAIRIFESDGTSTVELINGGNTGGNLATGNFIGSDGWIVVPCLGGTELFWARDPSDGTWSSSVVPSPNGLFKNPSGTPDTFGVGELVHVFNKDSIFVYSSYHEGIGYWNGTSWSMYNGYWWFSNNRHYNVIGISPTEVYTMGRHGDGTMNIYQWNPLSSSSIYGVDDRIVLTGVSSSTYQTFIKGGDDFYCGMFSPAYPSPANFIQTDFTSKTLTYIDCGNFLSTRAASGMYFLPDPAPPPSYSNISPFDTAISVDRDTSILITISESEEGVDISTVSVEVNSVEIFNGSSFASGWTSSSYSGSSASYDFTLVSDSSFSYGDTVSVDVYSENLSGSSSTESWSFTTELEPVSPTIALGTLGQLVTVTIEGSYFYNPFSGEFANDSSAAVVQSSSKNVVQRVKYWNEFDEHGSILSLSRLKNEKNDSYRRRLQHAASHLANCSYRGLINGITRELGLSLFDALSINPKVDGSGAFLASDPYIMFSGVWLLLYSDYTNNVLDWAIDRFSPGGNYEHLDSLISAVNNTSLFEASLKSNVDLYTKSMTILNQSNRNTVRNEIIPQSRRFKLAKTKPAKGTVFFSNRKTFKTEVSNTTGVVRSGQYHVNYDNGTVTVFSMPTPLEHVRYTYIEYPFCATASPIILHDINSDHFKVKMFQQILADNGEYVNGSPTELGTDIINELMSVSPMYWGR